eukprot:4792324-Prymnesium_polylepis.1
MSVIVTSALSWVEQRVLEGLNWQVLIHEPNGNFKRPGESDYVFPLAGISIKWRCAPPQRIWNRWRSGALLAFATLLFRPDNLGLYTTTGQARDASCVTTSSSNTRRATVGI